MGRCADVVLKDHENCYSFFIHSPLEERIKRIVETEHVTERQAKKMIKQTDWERSSYHNYYTKQKWGDPGNYDLMINSARTGIQKAVENYHGLCEIKTMICNVYKVSKDTLYIFV